MNSKLGTQVYYTLNIIEKFQYNLTAVEDLPFTVKWLVDPLLDLIVGGSTLASYLEAKDILTSVGIIDMI